MAVAALGVVGVDVDAEDGPAAAALLRGRAVPRVGQEVLHRRQQPGAEPPAVGVGVGQVVLLDQAGEEPLREVERLVGVIAPAAHEGVQRVPVQAAKLAQGLARLGRGGLAGGGDESPAGGREVAGAGERRVQGGVRIRSGHASNYTGGRSTHRPGF